jgi:glyoxylase-like metal-dependent hydrolase (beta-lactamase superfamily II)
VTQEIAADIYWLPVRGCNVYLVGSSAQWVLIDAGWDGCADAIRGAAQALFGSAARPAAILLTHAHPDHFGSAAELSRVWEVPIYAHQDDLPYLEGGVLSDDLLDPVGRVFKVIERVLPARTVERMRSSPLKDMVEALPGLDAGIPGVPDWEYIHTPGHSPGHVVFFRWRDRALIAGDAVLTAPLWGALPAVQRLSRPPWFVSWDWGLTKAAASTLAHLEPRVLAAGHGVPMIGDKVARELAGFAARRDRVVVRG